MSRREFRASVEERPVSAWTLVTVSSAMLWITEQLQPWVIAVQVVAFVFSLARRRSPLAFQKSPIWLNVGIFGITGTTISLALEGNPATVSLAHFAALTSGLQLMDARPRKSEFLLVALALFQVILASSLTDSLMFPPLLAVFVGSAVWTLIVHTLRMEALEAGEAGGAARAITPALMRTTVIATAASILVALVLFALLPRMKTSVLKGGLGRGSAVAGFSDQVELGTIGRIRQDPTVVLRIETLEGEAPEPVDAYWRGLAFDAFDGRRWSITPVERTPRAGSVKFGIEIGFGPRDIDLVQRIVREPVAAGVLFTAGTPRRVAGALTRIESDVNGGLYDPMQPDQRIRYTVESEQRPRSDRRLRGDDAIPPRDRGHRYLSLPVELAPEVVRLAESIVEGRASDAERALAIERHLREQGRYTDSPPPMGEEGERSPVEDFLLGELAGHCEYFASGMVVLARSAGLPARLVNGFAGGRTNPLGGFVELARSDAHAWVEIHYRDAGWVRYDPTPPDLRLREAGAASLAETLAAIGSTIELWWFQTVVDFDSSDQIAALKSAFATWRKWRAPSGGGESPDGRRKARDWDDALPWRALGATLLAAGLAGELLRRRRRATRGPGLPPAYARALALLARRGLVRAPARTARDFARDVAEAVPAAATPFETLTESYLATRFGARPFASDDESLGRLEGALREAARA